MRASTCSSTPVKYFGESPQIVDSSSDPYYIKLLSKYPPPQVALSSSSTFHEKVLALRTFAHFVLPKQSSWGQVPEPVRALELLGDNKKNEPYPNLCSKNSFIFIQYLTAIGITARPIGLQDHTSTEVWNPTTSKWEYHDSHFNDSPIVNGEYVSASKAHDLYMAGDKFEFRDDIKNVLVTVVYIPRSDFSKGHLPRWHYFDFDNLAYFVPQRLSAKSWDRWKKYSEIKETTKNL